jgi:hypothetical protein
MNLTFRDDFFGSNLLSLIGSGNGPAEAQRRCEDGTRFRGSDNDAGTAGTDSECSCETG